LVDFWDAEASLVSMKTTVDVAAYTEVLSD